MIDQATRFALYMSTLLLNNMFYVFALVGIYSLYRYLSGGRLWRIYSYFFGKRQKNPKDLRTEEFLAPFSLDIGGTMTKVCYLDFETREEKIAKLKEIGKEIKDEDVTKNTRTTVNIPKYVHFSDLHSSLSIQFGKNAVLRFLEFPSNEIEGFLSYAKENDLVKRFGKESKKCSATGGGAYKFSNLVKDTIGIQFVQRDEMESLILGLNFLFSLRTPEPPIFTYRDKFKIPIYFKRKENLYPYLLVQIGSGISMILVKSKRNFERVSGSSLGGGAFAGLCRIITEHAEMNEKNQTRVEKKTSYTEWIEEAKTGDNTNVDLMVGDIYGQDYGQHGLKADVIASSFGKVATLKVPEGKKITDLFSHGDAIKSLIFMFANNIAQLSVLNGEKHKAKNIIFSGGFIRSNVHFWSKLSYAMAFWTQGKKEAMFVRYEGYLGAIGAFIQK
jgi:type II pantothenate kinase